MAARPTYLVAVANGSIYMGYSPTRMTLCTGGEDVLVDTPAMGMQDGPPSPNDSSPASLHRHMYFVDGTNYYKLDAHTGAASEWTAFNGADAVTGDTISGTALPEDADSNTARIIALYRGRIVLAGVENDPHNWFMSAAFDPRNWDYNPTTVRETRAIAGNNSDAGKVGDRITALIPFSDDLLIFGGDHSIYQLTGDPAAGGVIDNLSQQTGIVGPDAWAFDPANTLYFVGNDNLYRMVPGGVPQPLSNGRLEEVFEGIDLTTHRVILQWDRERRGLFVFVVDDTAASSQPESFFWDARTDGFWPLALPDENGPTSVCTFDTDAAEDRLMLLGGRDGFVRCFRDGRPNDNNGADEDGFSTEQAIASHVALPPIVVPDEDREATLRRLRLVMGESSGDVTVAVQAGVNVEAVMDADTDRFTTTVGAGRAKPILSRARGNAIIVKLSQSVLNQTWSFEGGQAEIAAAGRIRGQ